MANKKTPIARLDSEINKILEDYGDSVRTNTIEVTKLMLKKGAQAVRASARSAVGGSGKYANGWTSEVEVKRYGVYGYIYNRNAYQLAHLLEYGHAKQDGGRVAGRPHIAPVEEELIKEYEEGVRNAIDTA